MVVTNEVSLLILAYRCRERSQPRRGNNDIYRPLSFSGRKFDLEPSAGVANEGESEKTSPEEEKEVSWNVYLRKEYLLKSIIIFRSVY